MREAYRWYEDRRPGLGDDFMEAIEAVFDRLSSMPEVHQVIHKDVRRALSQRFPYGIYYRVLEDRVEVIAIQHSKRDPSRWQSRVP